MLFTYVYTYEWFGGLKSHLVSYRMEEKGEKTTNWYPSPPPSHVNTSSMNQSDENEERRIAALTSIQIPPSSVTGIALPPPSIVWKSKEEGGQSLTYITSNR